MQVEKLSHFSLAKALYSGCKSDGWLASKSGPPSEADAILAVSQSRAQLAKIGGVRRGALSRSYHTIEYPVRAMAHAGGDLRFSLYGQDGLSAQC